MITIEKFYMDESYMENMTASSDGIDYTISFIPSKGEGIHIDIKVRGEEDFIKFMKNLNNLVGSLIDE